MKHKRQDWATKKAMERASKDSWGILVVTADDCLKLLRQERARARRVVRNVLAEEHNAQDDFGDGYRWSCEAILKRLR